MESSSEGWIVGLRDENFDGSGNAEGAVAAAAACVIALAGLRLLPIEVEEAAASTI
jgi:hypothetical protein